MNLAPLTQLLAKCALATALVTSCTSAPSVRWIEGASDSKGKAVHTIEIINAKSLPDGWTIWFSMFPQRISALEGSDAAVKEYQANVHQITPGVAKDTIRIFYRASALTRRSWAPEGFVLQTAKGSKPLSVSYEFQPLAPDGEKWVKWNASKRLSEPAAARIIPLPKNRVAEVRPRGWYKLTTGETVIIEAEDPDGEYYAQQTLAQLRENHGGEVPEMTIEDWPDYQYRGFMLDIARNFTTKENLLTLIDVLSRYKLNVLHLHFGDDEGWRLEIDGIPELTSVGAFHSLDFEHQLQPSYDGNADPENREALSNGYYSRADFIEILRYATARHMSVIPEFDTPGHARAAIKAMKAYEKRTGDASMRLQDPADDSKYYTAQGFTDNVMSVELESVYTFIGKVFDSIIAMYAEAGVELPAIHIGGDEVPSGAWHGEDRHEFYLGRVARLAKEKGIKISGWQEVAGCKNPAIAELLRSVTYSTNVWVTIGPYVNKPYEIADMGFPVVQSNCEYTYADQAYSGNKEELAHSWVGYIDDTEAFRFPLKEYPNIIGVQAQMWTETVRSWEDLCYDLFPKTVGVFERAWNRKALCSEDEFYSLIVWREMPYWDSKGVNYHIPQPGLCVVDGKPVGNSAIPGAEILIDEQPDRITARARFRSHQSVPTTILK